MFGQPQELKAGIVALEEVKDDVTIYCLLIWLFSVLKMTI